MHRMNSKAQIPITLLVIIALLLCIIAIATFVSYSKKAMNTSNEISALMSSANFNEQYLIEQTKIIAKETIKNCNSCDENSLKEKFKENSLFYEQKFLRPEIGNYYAQIRNANSQNNNLKIEFIDANIQVQINGLFVQFEKGNNKVKRNFQICLLFNKNGEFIKEC